MDLPSFTMTLRIEVQVVERWVEAGWLAPAREGAALRFTEADLARARLIRDMADEMGVNAEGIGVALGLLDQVHGLRLALRRVSACVATLPEEVRREALAALEREG
jgi:chaperone modulatory protein CbpM